MSLSRAAEEAEIVKRCAAGDAAAWDQFVERFGTLLRALVRRRLARHTGRSSDVDIDEVVGEVFLALVRRDRILLKRFDPQYRLSTYLGVICRTEVLRFLRRGRRHAVGLEAAEQVPDHPDRRGPLGHLADQERQAALKQVRAGLGTLGDRDRRLLTLKYLEGLDYRAIGEALGVNPESVGQFLHRAKRRLAERVPDLERWIGSLETQR